MGPPAGQRLSGPPPLRLGRGRAEEEGDGQRGPQGWSLRRGRLWRQELRVCWPGWLLEGARTSMTEALLGWKRLALARASLASSVGFPVGRSGQAAQRVSLDLRPGLQAPGAAKCQT